MAGGSYLGGGAYLDVDMSEVQQTINLLRGCLSRKNFERLIYRTFKEVGERSKPIINKPVTLDYAVKKTWVNSQIDKYKLEMGGWSGVTCKIPLKGKKGTIGGRFAARGGYKGKIIQARILRGSVSYMPRRMKNQGGNPPFINPNSQKLNGVAFTRRGKGRLPIVRVVGLGVPQMPLNRSEDEVQEGIIDLAWKRLEHNFHNMFIQGNR